MSLILTLVIVVFVLLLLVIGVIIVASRYARNNEDEADPLLARLAEASHRGEVVSLEEIELQQPFTERVIVPLMRRLGEISTRFTPQRVLEDTTRKLELAGNPGRIDAATFLSSRFVFMILFGGILLAVSIISRATNPWPVSRVVLVVGLFSAIGFAFPGLLLRSRINRRQREIRKAMPDALDLLTICVEAGLGFDAAMSKVSEKWENELSIAFGRCIREIQLGKTQREALRDMADRLGIPEMTSFVAAVIQSQILGVSLAKVLRIQSDQMRIKRRQLAEEEAHKAPVKMVLPMVFLTFPSILLILLTPAGIQISKTFGAFGGIRFGP
jgi:tight adherence protein C